MKQEINQKGTGAIGIIVIVLTIAVVAFAGWYMWNKNKKDGTNKPTGQTAQNQDQPKPDEQKPADPTEGGKYLVISEWGVRFPLSEELQGDVEYGIRKNVLLNDTAPDGATPIYGDVVYFASKKLIGEAKPNSCGLKAGARDDLNQRDDPTSYDGGPGIALQRWMQNPGSRGINAGGYWYVSQGSRAMCYPGSDGAKESSFVTSVSSALKSVEATPNN